MNRDFPIYLDGFSTLPLSFEAREAMMRAWESPGNAGSPHSGGEHAARLIAEARADVASLIGASPAEIIFTSGATEANNLALLGVARALRGAGDSRRRIVISAIEHKSVIEPAKRLEAEGFEIIAAPVDRYGVLDIEALRSLVTGQTLLVSVMMANNETGALQPVAEAASIAHGVGALMHSDGAQALGKVPIDLVELDIDYASFSAHKCYGPMGIGALFVAAGVPRPEPLLFGGGQQSALRSGTEPVALIAGFGGAAVAARDRLFSNSREGRQLAAALRVSLEARQLKFDVITGEREVLPGSLVIAVDGADADMICAALARGVHLSTGSACASGQLRSSHVLESMGLSEDVARSVVRIFCHRYLSSADIEAAAEQIVAAAHRSSLAAGEVRQ